MTGRFAKDLGFSYAKGIRMMGGQIMTTITVQLDDSKAALLQEKAGKHGLSLDQLVTRWIFCLKPICHRQFVLPFLLRVALSKREYGHARCFSQHLRFRWRGRSLYIATGEAIWI